MIARAPAGYKKQRLKALDRLVQQKAARRAAILQKQTKPAPSKRKAKPPRDSFSPVGADTWRDTRVVMVQMRSEEYEKLSQRAEANEISPELYLLAAMRFAMEAEE